MTTAQQSPKLGCLLLALSVTCLTVAIYAPAADAQVKAFKLKKGHLSELIIDQGAQLVRLVRVDAHGQEVSVPFDVLIQHRSGPEDQEFDDRWARVDSIITCFPASIEHPTIRSKTILKDKPGAIEIRRYISGILIVEPIGKKKQPLPCFPRGPFQ